MVFKRFYVSFKGVMDEWLYGYRNVVGVDGCFLKGICKGELLLAMGRDANNHIYHIAWEVVNVESKSTWKWFLDKLIEGINGRGNSNGITLILDRYKVHVIFHIIALVLHTLTFKINVGFNGSYEGKMSISGTQVVC